MKLHISNFSFRLVSKIVHDQNELEKFLLYKLHSSPFSQHKLFRNNNESSKFHGTFKCTTSRFFCQFRRYRSSMLNFSKRHWFISNFRTALLTQFVVKASVMHSKHNSAHTAISEGGNWRFVLYFRYYTFILKCIFI